MDNKQSPLRNKLLAALSKETQARLFPVLEFAPMPLGAVIYKPGVPQHTAYFPTDCIVSLLYCMENGSTGEIAIVGKEGMVGIPLLMGGSSTSSTAVVQNAGCAYQLLASAVQEEFERHGDFAQVVLRYTQSLITQMTQTAACNRHHSVHEQLARWVLMSLDRLAGETMTMTPRLVANMLSISIARVAEVAGRLERLGVISYNNGMIKVLDRSTLENLSCECYGVVRAETARLLPSSV